MKNISVGKKKIGYGVENKKDCRERYTFSTI